MKYKYITIQEIEPFHNKPRYEIRNNKSEQRLGLIFYYPRWRQYVFTQFASEVIFNKGCLTDIIDFIENHTQP
jgi:hypothetical protein